MELEPNPQGQQSMQQQQQQLGAGQRSRHVARMPSLGQLSSSPSGGTSSSGASSLTRSVSINSAPPPPPPQSNSAASNRMLYSPAGPQQQPPQPSHSPNTLGAWLGAQGRPDQQYRSTPSSSSSLPPPQAGLMRRGMSYDSVYNPGGASPSALPSLLPTSYTSGRAPPPSYGGTSPMRTDYPAQQAQQLPHHFHQASISSSSASGSGAASLGHGQPPGSAMGGSDHNRHASYSPSHYAAQSATAPPPPPSTATAYTINPTPSASSSSSTAAASSFYPSHIVSAQQLAAAAPPSSASPLAPPQPSQTPSHQPQAQQYYQSQAYYDATLQSSSATTQQQQQQPPSASPNPANAASQYYAGGDVLRSASAAYAPRPQGQVQGQGPARGGFRKVRDVRDIKRTQNTQPAGRRADPAGGFISPLRALTTHLPQTYHLVNPTFHYETSLNPRRVLTKPSKPAQNGGFDNEDSDYILYVNDVLGPEDKDRYLILDVLGQGTFGQVVKCQNMKTHEIVAVKVVKNKPAYFQQSMMEVTILELINNQWDKDDEHHMLRLKDTFIHHSHLCLVFELLSNNLYELIKQNSFRGLSTSLVRVFTAQLLDALTVLQEAKIIHCDLKPENILLKSLQSPTIKVIDFGSACHEKQTVYTYIQSRFYRSPEVILSLPYSASIDMWSLGCICVELFLGLPLFPGTSEFNQITRIVEMLGMPPDHMLEKGKQTNHFFEPFSDEYGRRRWRLKSLERYAAEFKAQEQPSKKYFQATTLPEIIRQYPIIRKGLKETEIDKEMKNRMAFIDFVKGLLHLDPDQRWSPQQARLHPFVLGEPFTTPFVPPIPKSGFPAPVAANKASAMPTSPQPDPAKRYGGLPPAPQRSTTRTYQDAKAYNQHLMMQQGYTAQAQQAAQRASQVPTNPYQDAGYNNNGGGNGQRGLPTSGPSSGGQMSMMQQQQMAQQQQQQQQQMQMQQAVAAQQQAAYGAAQNYGQQQQQQRPPPNQLPPVGVANPPPVHHYTTRGRSNTLQPDLPPALLKLGPNLINSGTGQSITPVLRREDQTQAWERMQGAGGSGVQRRQSIGRHPHLNLLQEQAESGVNWQSPHRAKPAQQPGYSAYYQSPNQPQQAFQVVVDSRDVFDSSSAPTPYGVPGGGNNGGAPFSPPGPSQQQQLQPQPPPQAYSQQANTSRYAAFSGGQPPQASYYDQPQQSFYSTSIPTGHFPAVAPPPVGQKASTSNAMDLWPR